MNADARLILIDLKYRGEGSHEISFDEWSMLLNQAGADRIRRAVHQAQLAGWMKRSPGGRGHPDRYEFSTEGFRPANEPTLSDRLPETPTLSDNKDAEEPHPKGLGYGKTAPYGGVGGEEVDKKVGGSEKEERAGARFTIHANAKGALEQHDELLTGCRGALRDYLRARVPPGRQLGFVQTLAGWRGGGRRRLSCKHTK